MLKIDVLEFGSLLSYTPKPMTDAMEYSKKVKNLLKNDKRVSESNKDYVPFSEWAAKKVGNKKSELPFPEFFGEDVTLIPVPRSSLTQPNTLWVPLNIALALVKNGLARAAEPILIRTKAVNQSSMVSARDRPSPLVHYDSMSVKEKLIQTDKIVLVDDVITRGATAIGAVNKLFDAFPDKKFYCLAIMRTISNPADFVNWYDPVRGIIKLRESGDTIRRP